MKKRVLALALAVVLTLGLLPLAGAAELPFVDVAPWCWFYEEVCYAYEKGLVNGTDATHFSPDQNITRAMFLTFLYRLEGQPEVESATFLDVAENSWYAKPVSWARSNQIVYGYGDGRFGPDDILSREQMITILYRYAAYLGYDLSISVGVPDFDDVAEVEDYSLSALRWAVSFQIISGTGGNKVSPDANVTRAQVAALLSRFDKNAGPVEGKPYLSHFVADTTEFISGEDCVGRFTVRTHGESDKPLYLYVDGTRVAELNDAGLEGDAVAGDGIYSVYWYARYDISTTANVYVFWGGSMSRMLPISFLPGGTLTGLVCDWQNNQTPLANTLLQVYRDGMAYANTTTDSEGRYKIHLPAGNYHIRANKQGYAVFDAYATVTGDSNTYTETYMMVQGNSSSNGSGSGTITSAMTGQPLKGIVLYVRNGWNNSNVGAIVAKTVTDANGKYYLNLPQGNYTVSAAQVGYITLVFNIVITGNGAQQQNGSIRPTVTTGDYSVVLKWGEQPRDLDSHLQRITSGGATGYHVYFANRNGYINNDKKANLDVDNTIGFGPETVTYYTKDGDTYYYYVHHYAGEKSIARSQANVTLYQGNYQVAIYYPPTDQGDGRYWNVFAMKDGKITVRNTITSQPELSYMK